MIIYLDMDGVTADFQARACRLFARSDLLLNWPVGKSSDEAFGVSRARFWEVADRKAPKFFAELHEMPWFDELHAGLSKLGEVVFCSRPTWNHEHLAQKLEWLQLRFGRDFSSYSFLQNKSLLAKPGTLLVDDEPDNVASFVRAGGRGLLFPQPWNGSQLGAYDKSKVGHFLKAAKLACS